MRRMHSDETERPSSAQRTKDEVDDEADAAAEQQSEDEESDPAEKIVDFDWEDLEARYHDAMKTCHNQEDLLMQELRTRSTYVQHEEAELEQKRNHYINVVKAFESALNLLKASGLGR
ncbi:uncharacterized protein J4E88_008875 [Alternaria novae-zelandiae]|uniref:uncharacterized protein n=1 Tax=Alternaria novae-zelandiae TaxID=430562 RepID=UPI0020C3C840|nr:uncharacterized protein J4E88_008875 [Alternaria novae-zelandiae]KAI4673263.1 hypothetical protein J4E88_008875 [Alternaria novae-zelandiae]